MTVLDGSRATAAGGRTHAPSGERMQAPRRRSARGQGPKPSGPESVATRIERHEAELRRALEELEVAARRTVHPGEWVRSRPKRWLLGSLAVGFACGWVSSGSRAGASRGRKARSRTWMGGRAWTP